MGALGMRNLMLKCDICISAGGQTLYELVRVGLPTIGICFADNQIVNLQGFRKKSFFRYIGSYKETNILDKISEAIRYFESQTIRSKSSITAKSLVDGKGADRAVKEILCSDMLKKGRDNFYIRNVRRGDCRDLWVWRKHPKARRWSFNAATIKYKNHSLWFDRKVKDEKTKIYIAENRNNEKMAQVRFENGFNDKAYINVNLNPAFFNKGIGSKVIKTASDKFIVQNPEIKEIIAEILSDNIGSRKAFHKAGYIFTGNISKKGKQVVVFKLRK